MRTLLFGLCLWVAMAAGARAADGAHADLPGVKLWYTDTGGKGTPIVMLHANTGTTAVWDKQNKAFSAAGYRVIAFDRRGWGKSMPDPATGPQPGSIAGDLDALVTHLKLGKFYLLGVAGGGFAALDYAAWHQEHLRGLIIGASTGAFSEKVMTDMTSRIAIPGLDKQPSEYVGPGGHRALERYRGARPPARRPLPAPAHPQHLRQGRNDHGSDPDHRRGCRPVRAPGADADMGRSHQAPSMDRHRRRRPFGGVGEAGAIQRRRAGLSAQALTVPE
jgi:pimeloyl-ACP methyl ester carboxylesterase